MTPIIRRRGAEALLGGRLRFGLGAPATALAALGVEVLPAADSELRHFLEPFVFSPLTPRTSPP
jgi:hypothetical protein